MKILSINRKNTLRNGFYWLPRILTIVVIVAITFYTISLFFHAQLIELVFYLIPSFVLLILLDLVWRHEKLGGILFLLISFGFLLIYQFYVSITVFSLLLLIGGLFLFDDYRIHHRTRR